MKRIGERSVAVFMAVLVLVIGVLGATDAVYADNENYGEDAYYYMKELSRAFPNRVAGSEVLDSAKKWLHNEAAAMGYDVTLQSVSWPHTDGRTYTGENLIFVKEGKTDREIVIGAHYDSVATNGADDNASGVGLLLETAKRLKDVKTEYTLRFILFTLEEPGCFGSLYYVQQASQEELGRIACMVNLDTLAAGDNMYLYGGGVDNGTTVRTWAVEQALFMAEEKGLAMSFHPDVNAAFPAPAKHTASDQMAFDRAGIPYVYFEASNWMGGEYTNFFQTADPAIANGKMMHVPEYDNMDFYNSKFPGRAFIHLEKYAILLNEFLRSMVAGSSVPPITFEKVNETVMTTKNVNVRKAPGTSSDIVILLEGGELLQRIGYQAEWSEVIYDGQTCYIASEFLTTDGVEQEETTTEETSTEPTSKETEEKTTDAATKPSAEEITTAAQEEAKEDGSQLRWILIISIIIVAVAAAAAVFFYQRSRNLSE